MQPCSHFNVAGPVHSPTLFYNTRPVMDLFQSVIQLLSDMKITHTSTRIYNLWTLIAIFRNTCLKTNYQSVIPLPDIYYILTFIEKKTNSKWMPFYMRRE